MLDVRLEEVLSEARLPSMPAVARRILSITESGHATIPEIAEVIELDQALVVRLLRTVNSSYYALPRPCANISQAATLLGLRAVRSIVLGFSLARTLDGGDDREIDFPWRSYWRRSVRNAVSARLLARFGKGVDPDEAQLTGLLAEIGMVSMYRAFGDRYLQVKDEARGDHSRLIRDEQRFFEIDHAEVGAMMAKRWGLPPELANAIATHEREPARHMPSLEVVVALAGIAERGTGGTDARARAFAEASFLRHGEGELAMRGGDARQLLEQIGKRATELAAMLEIDIGDGADGDRLLDRARALQDPEARRAAEQAEAQGDRIGFERRLADLLATDARGTALLLIEPDAITTLRRQAPDAMTVARLEARLAETAGSAASVHRISQGLLAVVLPVEAGAAGAREAMKLAERVRRDCERTVPATRSREPNTISAGVAVHGAARFDSPDALVRAAMLALSAAQRGGRNRVGIFKPAHDPMTAAEQIR
ncbi:MAG: HDOD domain-containing protein [Phycisphaerae bacterium]|nr:HDOD domain-containing protein [Phycisphaerae bacterium]